MYLSAEVTDFENFSPTSYVGQTEIQSYKANKKEVLKDLKNYLLNDGNSLDGDEIQKHLFPETDVDIFLSHSHGDENDIIKLAILLERKGFNVFIDSCVWANSFDLLKVIDQKYCRNSDDSAYDYDKRNYSTSHVYMILNTALHKMIDRCEVFLFLGTPKSTTVKNGIENQKALNSPWIFSELAFSQHVRRKSSFNTDIFNSVTASLESRQFIMDSLQVQYDQPELDYKIKSETLNRFLNGVYTERTHSFTSLYSLLKKY